jgi:hypothetical protein
MLSWEVARQWQERNSMTPFEELLGTHLSCGLIHSTPSIFLLARKVAWAPIQKEIIKGNPNAWFVELAASSGNPFPIREFLRVAPHPLRWVLWCRQSPGRKHDIHAYDWNKLSKRVGLHPA